MNIKELIEIFDKTFNKYQMNELSDETKQSFLSGRQKQLDSAKSAYLKAQSKMDKALKMVYASDDKKINSFPTTTDKETAEEIISDLKSELKRYSDGSRWRNEQENDYLLLEVRHWGDWENPEDKEDEEDYDWQVLSAESYNALMNILREVQKRHEIKITYDIGEKNWLYFSVSFDKLTKSSVLDSNTELKIKSLILSVDGKGYEQKKVDDKAIIGFTVNMYIVEESIPYETDVPCELLIGDSVDLKINSKESGNFKNVENAFKKINTVKEEGKKVFEQYKKERQATKENVLWLNRKLLNEKPNITWLSVIDNHKVILKEKKKVIELEKIDKKRDAILRITIDGKTIEDKINKKLDFTDWLSIALDKI